MHDLTGISAVKTDMEEPKGTGMQLANLSGIALPCSAAPAILCRLRQERVHNSGVKMKQTLHVDKRPGVRTSVLVHGGRSRTSGASGAQVGHVGHKWGKWRMWVHFATIKWGKWGDADLFTRKRMWGKWGKADWFPRACNVLVCNVARNSLHFPMFFQLALLPPGVSVCCLARAHSELFPLQASFEVRLYMTLRQTESMSCMSRGLR